MKKIYIAFFYLLTSITFISHTFAQTTNGNGWQWQYPKPQGNTLKDIFVFDKGTAIAVGDLGTVIKTTDGGNSWDVQHHAGGTDAGLNSVYFLDALNGWTVGGNVVLKTRDGGNTWLQVKTDTTLGYNSVYFVDADTGFVFGEDGIILRTTNGGSSWDTRSIDNYIGIYLDVFQFNAVTFLDKQTGFLVGYGYYGNEIYKTTDCGRTWQWNEQIIMPKIFTHLNDITFLDKSNGFIVGGQGVFLKTTDGGNSWLRDTVGGNGYSVFFTDTLTGWTTGNGNILHTIDGGKNWTAVNSNQITNDALFKVRFSDQNYGWFVGGTGIIYITTDAGNNWIAQRQKAFEFSSIYFIDETTGWAVGDSGVVFSTTDSGISWNKLYQNDSLSLSSIYAIDNQNVFAVGLIRTKPWPSNDVATVILQTTNGGQTWIRPTFNSPVGLNSIVFINDSTGLISGNKGTILKTTDKGYTWNKISLYISVGNLDRIQFINENIGWIGSIIKTTDGGSSWTTQNIPSVLSFPSSYFVNEQIGWLVGDSYMGSNIYKTTNGGANWTPCGSTYSGYNFSIFFSNENTGWIGGYNNSNQRSIIKTADGGNTWVGQDIPSKWVTDLYFLNENTGWATGGEGIFKTINGGVNGIKDISGHSPSIPKEIELYQNYPNPFNPSTIIEYRLAQRQQVNLQIFNILGQEIALLVDEIQNVGSYKINWKPGKVTSGVYFYRLTTPSQGVVKKMLLIR